MSLVIVNISKIIPFQISQLSYQSRLADSIESPILYSPSERLLELTYNPISLPPVTNIQEIIPFSTLQLSYQSFTQDNVLRDIQEIIPFSTSQLSYQSTTDIKTRSLPYLSEELVLELDYNPVTPPPPPPPPPSAPPRFPWWILLLLILLLLIALAKEEKEV